MEDNLRLLADKLGIVTKFSDAGLIRKEYDVSEDVIQFIAQKLGYESYVGTELPDSLQMLADRRWKYALEKIYVVEKDDLHFDIVIPSSQTQADLDLMITQQGSGKGLFGQISYEVFPIEEYALNGINMTRLIVKISSPFPIGYYDLTFKVGDDLYFSTMAVSPKKCFENEALKGGKVWGFSVQLYSLNSKRNWGVGDFTDLADLAKIGAHNGASVIGLNPLNVLNHTYPENASPYSSLNRLFMNPIYIDVENVPEFLREDKDRIAEELKAVHEGELINYTKVYELKIKMLEEMYQRFKSGKDQNRQEKYRIFCGEYGEELEKMAIFQALYEEKCAGEWCGGWRSWEKEYQDPNSEAIQKYAISHQEQIEFFKFMQFEATRQFDLACAVVTESGMKIGFYRDLAVGVSSDSNEVWADPDLFISGVGTGAPPDAFFPNGQKWCLATFNPQVLKDKRYEPFIKILRANMRSAGALRIDHVMGLMRLYVIPDHLEKGTYLLTNFQDLLNIVALESHLNQCTIVGESIGNVPEGFLDILRAKNIYSLSVLWAERHDAGWGDFCSPQEYPEYSFTSVGTHDMSPLRMWWFGYDLELMRKLDIIDSDEAKADAYKKREIDRWKLLHVLDINGVWPEDNLRKSDYLFGENYPEGIEEAVHRLVARSASKVFLVQLEDILHVEKLQNLPGVDYDKHPNWRRKLPVYLEDLEQDIAYIRNIQAITKER